MTKLEDIMNGINNLTPFDSEQKKITPAYLHSLRLITECQASRRLVIAAGPEASHLIVIEGEADLVRKLGGAQERLRYHRDLDVGGGEEMTGIVLTMPSKGEGTRRFAYLINDLIEQMKNTPTATAGSLCSTIRPHISALIDIGNILDDNKQMGLTGELILLEHLLRIAKFRNTPLHHAMDTWQNLIEVVQEAAGSEERKDFSGNTIAVEAKATSKDARKHLISNWVQLHPQAGETLYIFSCSIRPARGGTLRLVDQLRKVRTIMGDDIDQSIKKEFNGKLKGQGFLIGELDSYELAVSFTIDTFSQALVQINDDIGILRSGTPAQGGSFVEGHGPSSPNITAESISYELDLSSCTSENGQLVEADSDEFDQILYRMMTGKD